MLAEEVEGLGEKDFMGDTGQAAYNNNNSSLIQHL